MLHSLTLAKPTTKTFLHYFLLAFIAMAGLAYINFLPALVNALADGIGFTEAEAGQIVSANGYGSLAGSAAAIYLVNKTRLQTAIFSCLVLLVVADLGSTLLDSYSLMLACRFVAGLAGGLSTGLAFAMLARQSNPDRAFGMLLLIQFTIGSMVIYLIPMFEKLLNAYAVFYLSAAIAGLALLFMLFLPAQGLLHKPAVLTLLSSTAKPARRVSHAALLLLAITLYQTAASAIWAYIGLMGRSVGIAVETVNTAIAVTGLLGLAGAMLPVIIGGRSGRLNWLVAGIALSAISSLLLVISPLTLINQTLQHAALELSLLYSVAIAVLFFCWPAVISFLFAVCADLNSNGRLATIAALTSSVGLATGPLLGSVLIDENNFSLLLFSCAALFLLSLLFLFKPVQAHEKLAAAKMNRLQISQATIN